MKQAKVYWPADLKKPFLIPVSYWVVQQCMSPPIVLGNIIMKTFGFYECIIIIS